MLQFLCIFQNFWLTKFFIFVFHKIELWQMMEKNERKHKEASGISKNTVL